MTDRDVAVRTFWSDPDFGGVRGAVFPLTPGYMGLFVEFGLGVYPLRGLSRDLPRVGA